MTLNYMYIFLYRIKEIKGNAVQKWAPKTKFWNTAPPLPHPPTKRGKYYCIIFVNDCVQSTTVKECVYQILRKST